MLDAVGKWVARASVSGNVIPSMYKLRHEYPVRVMFVGWPGVHVKDYADQREVISPLSFYGFSIGNVVLVRFANYCWITTAYLFSSLRISTTTSSTSVTGDWTAAFLLIGRIRLVGSCGPSSTVLLCRSCRMKSLGPLTSSNGLPIRLLTRSSQR